MPLQFSEPAKKLLKIEINFRDTIKREFGNPDAIKDNYPKFVDSVDTASGGFSEYPDIGHVNLQDFLKTDL